MSPNADDTVMQPKTVMDGQPARNVVKVSSKSVDSLDQQIFKCPSKSQNANLAKGERHHNIFPMHGTTSW